MWRSVILTAGLFACLIPAGTLAQGYRKTVTVEVYLPEGARLFIEGQETRSEGPMSRFVSPPLPPGKYTYTIKAIVPGLNGPRTVTRRIDVRPGDFESIDLREPGKRPMTDVEYEPAPQKVVDALLRLARVTSKDVVWDLGCGDGRIPVTAARVYACKACGFDIDPERVKESLANVRQHGVERLVTIERRDIFTLDLSKGPTIVTLYLLPRLNARLLPQLRKLPPGARVLSVAHRMADVKPDEQIVVDTELGEFDVYLWKVETLRGKSAPAPDVREHAPARRGAPDLGASRSHTARPARRPRDGHPGHVTPPWERSGPFHASAARSKRSRFITLCHAATKSRTNACCESSHAYTSAMARSWEFEPKTRSTAVPVHLT
jgi:uncharacterized protein (TIGR03000 family)